MAFEDYAAELVGSIPRLDYLKARQLVNRAWREIRDSRPWSFLLEEATLDCPAIISTGTVAVVQFTSTVTASGDSKTALDAVGIDIPLNRRQFRLTGASQVYNITDYSSTTGVITLDRKFVEDTNPTATYQVFRCYFQAPDDFQHWVSIRDIKNGYSLKLHGLHQMLDLRDPYRATTGNPVQVFSYKTSSTGIPIYELWPHPTVAQSLLALYQRKGTDLVDGESLPAYIPEELIAQRALYYASQWALMNVGRYPELRGTTWQSIMMDTKVQYEVLLNQAIRQDDEVFLQNWIIHRDSSARYPVDSKFLQSHDFGLGG